MAARTRRDVRVAAGQPFAVDARRVFGRLVDALLRRERAHHLGVAVTASAGRDDRLTGRLSLERHRGLAAADVVRPRLVGRRGLPTVAVVALESFLSMDVDTRERLRRRREALIRERRMAGD